MNVTVSPSSKPLNTFLIGAVAAMSGLLFGFDASIAASVGDSVNHYFQLTDAPLLQGLWVAAVPFGALIGALFGGVVCSKLGRRRGLLLNAVLFVAGLLLSSLSPTFAVYVASRLLMGLAIGNSAVITPMYMAEVAPPDTRGRILFFYQLSIVIGILVSFIVGVVVNAVVTDHDLDWRVMIACGLAPATLFLLGMLRMPFSPRWLVEKGLHDEAQTILTRMVGNEKAQRTFREIQAANERKSPVNLKALLNKYILPVILLGFFLQFFQQTTGINADMYFGPEIFREGGFSHAASMWAQVGMGTVNLVATVVSIFLVDRLGRRKLMFVGATGIVIMLVVQAGLFTLHDKQLPSTPDRVGTRHVLPNVGTATSHLEQQNFDGPETAPSPTTGEVGHVDQVLQQVAKETGTDESTLITTLIFISILLFIVFFAISAGPLAWLMISEIFPLRFKGIGMSIAVAANWFADYLVSQLFPWMKTDMGMPITLMIYAAFTVVGLVLAVKFLPETKGTALEEIEANIYAGKPLRKIGEANPQAVSES